MNKYFKTSFNLAIKSLNEGTVHKSKFRVKFIMTVLAIALMIYGCFSSNPWIQIPCIIGCFIQFGYMIGLWMYIGFCNWLTIVKYIFSK